MQRVMLPEPSSGLFLNRTLLDYGSKKIMIQKLYHFLSVSIFVIKISFDLYLMDI